jgi:hypothetical protein
MYAKKAEKDLHVNFEKPQKGHLYIFDKSILFLPDNITIIIGGITVSVKVNKEVQKVEFYVDDILKNTDKETPYKWKWDETVFGKHTLKAIAYDNDGNIDKDEMGIWIFGI